MRILTDPSPAYANRVGLLQSMVVVDIFGIALAILQLLAEIQADSKEGLLPIWQTGICRVITSILLILRRKAWDVVANAKLSR